MSGGDRTMFRTVVNGVQIAAVLAVLVFVVMLFANEPSRPDPIAVDDRADTDGEAPADETVAVDGAAVYGQRCASCHGADATGGGTGPALAGRVVDKFPDIDDQIAVVSDGRRGMPGFGDRLTPEEIEAVVEFTRSL